MQYKDMSDEELEHLVEDAQNVGDAAGGLAFEAFQRYKNKKNECQAIQGELDMSDNCQTPSGILKILSRSSSPT